jgi:hypothetical protein
VDDDPYFVQDRLDVIEKAYEANQQQASNKIWVIKNIEKSIG